MSWLIYAALADGGENLTLSYCSTSDTAESTELPDARALEADAAMLSGAQAPSCFPLSVCRGRRPALKGHGYRAKAMPSLTPDGERLVQDINYSFRMPELGGEERRLTAAGAASRRILCCSMDFSKGRSLDGIRSEIDRLPRRALHLRA